MKALAPRTRPLLEGIGVSATDIIMNLFIFFFIAFSLLATFNKKKIDETPGAGAGTPAERQQQILLPTSTREAPGIAPDALQIELAPGQEIRVEGRAVAAEDLTGAVKRALGDSRRGVIVRAHKDLSLGATVTLMDRIWAAGPSNVAIATLSGEP